MTRKTINVPPDVQMLLDRKAPVCVGISGGKDSAAVAWAVAQHLQGYEGPKLLVHADLGVTEWKDSWESCRRIANRIGWELVDCRRPSGDMMDRWESRWESSRRRYTSMETAAVVLPWSTPAMRFCQSELKVDPITSLLKRRFGKVAIINVTGVRAQESATRAKQAVCAPAAKLPVGSLAWRPIHHWSVEEVWEAISESGIEAHEAYEKFGSSRVSCVWCILASEVDLLAGLKDDRNHALYARMCGLELASGFAFQGNRWLTSLAPELVPDGADRLVQAKELAVLREAAQMWLPKHLQFTKGWPNCVPTLEESAALAEMRRKVCSLYGWETPYATTETVQARYRELWELKNRTS